MGGGKQQRTILPQLLQLHQQLQRLCTIALSESGPRLLGECLFPRQFGCGHPPGPAPSLSRPRHRSESTERLCEEPKAECARRRDVKVTEQLHAVPAYVQHVLFSMCSHVFVQL